MKGTNIRLAAASLLCAATSWAGPVPEGAMADYHVQCNFGTTHSEAACAALVDQLRELQHPTRVERLALLKARDMLARHRGSPVLEGELCAGVGAVVRDHPDYAEAVYYLAVDCSAGRDEFMARLRRVLEIEPDNYDALSTMLSLAEGFWGEGRLPGPDVPDVAPETLATYREALYEAARERVAWKASIYPKKHDGVVWQDLFRAAGRILAAADRAGDDEAAEALRARIRRDAGFDTLDYGEDGTLALACQPISLLEEVCLSAIEKLAAVASADGLPLPGDVLEVVGDVTERLRYRTCSVSLSGDTYGGGMTVLSGDQCRGAEATESSAVARLRAVLEHHGGAWSSEHHRVHSQGFLGDAARLDGLREALRADPGNARARCDLTRALAARGRAVEAHGLEGGDTDCPTDDPLSGFTWVDRDDYVAWLERNWEEAREGGPEANRRSAPGRD
ncbi:MAG: hypothetical protein OXU77_03760 [Gammaproteobacteria bacterium]|nr:hypothetical protein [Gammaproteobacteria bacterium]MDE0442557.1 hypothetical protein [Gammaproteobacteria bacterium]